MPTPILATKLHIQPLRPQVVLRPRLVERLNAGLHRKLTLISAPAGFGKTTLISEWIAGCERPAAWLSLDDGENDPTRFVTYLIAALQTMAAHIGAEVEVALHSAQPPPIASLLTTLLNDITTIPDPFVLVLDDYHLVGAQSVDQALTFLLEHLPPKMHLVIATREDPHLPLARLRARNQLTEIRAKDLRFTPSEAGEFLVQVMGLTLSAEDVAALERRTEGWIAGLQLAAISLQGQHDATRFITSFTGSHHFVVDYLVEEVLRQQSPSVQTFLLHTSILDRLCGSLCDAVVLDPSRPGQETLEYLERANLFVVPLDNERRWYRYHHLFADVLRQRLHQGIASSSKGEEDVSKFHRRASVWYEGHGLELEAFTHAAASQDVERATRLLEGNGMPLHFRGGVIPVLHWLKSLPSTVLDASPALWVMYASALSAAGQNTGIEEKLQAAEAALPAVPLDDTTRNLVGHIAAIRATLAANNYQVETIITQSHRALEYLHPDNLDARTVTSLTLGYAYQLQGDRAAARRTYTDAIAISQTSGHSIITIMAAIGLGNIQEADTQLHLAAATYQHALDLLGEPPLPVACEAHLGLARICYEWNDLGAALQHGHQSVHLARQIENMDRWVASEVFLARLKLAQADVAGAAAILAQAGQSAHQHHFVLRLPEVAAAQVLMLLQQGNVAAAARLAETHDLPISQARVHLAQGYPSAALAVLEPWRRQVEAKGWADARLQLMVLQALALQALGEPDQAMQRLGDALALAEPDGFTRTFVDEGLPMAHLLSAAAAHGMMLDSIGNLLAVCTAQAQQREATSSLPPPTSSQPSPLSQREGEILHLIAEGRTNQEIAGQLFLALSTVKGYARSIFGKLGAQRRTEAVARAHELGLL